MATICCLSLRTSISYSSNQEEGANKQRIGFSAGMGVNFHNAQDLVARVNGSGAVSQRADEFNSGVEFFGAAFVPMGPDWVMKAEYVYMHGSYSLRSVIANGVAEFAYTVHLPGVIVQYVLVDEPTYNVKAGAGAGYHFGSYDEKFFSSRFTAHGVGALLELEGKTALSDDVFAYFGVQGRWEFIGELKDKNGKSPFLNTPTTMDFFSIAVRFGMTFYL
ncbi:MAG: hypothetical protein KIT50_00500 [Bacteroidetes bacterium]|nr:hypothetical protein [Bacteroidota bacterium]